MGRAGKGGAAVVVQEKGIGAQVLKAGDATTEGSDLIAELLELLSEVVSVERVQDGLGIAVEGLSGKSELASALRDRAVGPVEDGGRVGDTKFVG